MTGLVLSGYNLAGKVPSNISELSSIITLDLSFNPLLTGTIPKSIGYITTIVGLHLDQCKFSGSIPASLGNLHSLTTIDLSSNFLTGSLPSSIGSMKALTNLYVNANLLTGPIPSSLFLLSSLQNVYLDTNLLTGTIPNNIGNASSVTYLLLKFNSVSGTVPDHITSLSKLSYLDISHNFLTGTIPDQIGKLVDLTTLGIYSTLVIGSIPSSISMLTKLSSLDLVVNLLTGTIPTNMSALSALSFFQNAENLLSGPIPPDLCKLPTLSNLNMGINLLTGTIPHNIGHLNKLTLLGLFSNRFHGTIPSSTGNLTRLRSLNFEGNGLTGTIPPELGNFPFLTSLYLNMNKLVGTIPTALNRLALIQEIQLQQNKLVGLIPDLSPLLLLRTLLLYDNKLTGTIPSSLGNVSYLVTLELYNNKLTGTIPESLYTLKNLRGLLLSENMLHGTISPSVGRCPFLTDLYFSGNRLTGTIPAEITTLYLLNKFALGSNMIEGTLPVNITRLVNLQELVINDAHLTGDLSANDFDKMLSLRVLDLSGNLFSGSLPQYLKAQSVLLARCGFVGTIPSSYYGVNALDLHSNFLTGAIDDAFKQSSSPMEDMLLDKNLLTGKPLESVSNHLQAINQSYLAYVNISRNYLSGTLSTNLSTLVHVNDFELMDNFFSGSLADGLFGDLKLLATLRLSHNLLSGSLTDQLFNSSRSNLIVDIDNNAFTGSLPFAMFVQGNIQSFVASINCMGGILPESLCANAGLVELLLDGMHAAPSCSQRIIPSLPNSGFLLGNERLHGSIPSCLFGLPLLSTLHLSGNGLQGSITLPPATSSASISPQKTSLEVSSASSSASVPLSSLVTLDLSHNALTGSIPLELMISNITLLDLSFNRIDGTIPSVTDSYGFYNNSNDKSRLTLEVNRLSGSVPSNLLILERINILNGNMFGCYDGGGNRQNDLPREDPQFDTYQCGSDYTNYSLVATLALALVVACVIATYRWRYKASSEKVVMRIHGFLNSLQTSSKTPQQQSTFALSFSAQSPMFSTDSQSTMIASLSAVSSFSSLSHLSALPPTCRRILQLVFVVTTLMLCVGMPLYGSLSVYFGSYEHQYIWTISLSFLSGMVPALILFFALLLLLVNILRTILYEVHHRETTSTTNNLVRQTEESPLSQPSDRQDSMSISERDLSVASQLTAVDKTPVKYPVLSFLAKLAMICVDFTVVLAVNAAFVYGVSQQLPAYELLALSFTVSLFKLLWSNVVINELFIVAYQTYFDTHTSTSNYQVLLAIFNNILAPYLAEALISPNCFKYAVTQPPLVSSLETGGSCFIVEYTEVTIVVSEQITTQLINIVCAPKSTLPSNYTILADIVSTTDISYYPAFQYNYQCSSSLLASFAFIFVLRYVMSGLIAPAWMWMLKCLQTHWIRTQRVGWAMRVTMLLPPLHQLVSIDDIKEEGSVAAPTTTASASGGNVELNADVVDLIYRINLQSVRSILSKPLNAAASLRVRLISDLAVMFSYGVLFPPLMLVIALTLAVDMYSTQLALGRLLCVTNEVNTDIERRTMRMTEVGDVSSVSFDADVNSNLDAPPPSSSPRRIDETEKGSIRVASGSLPAHWLKVQRRLQRIRQQVDTSFADFNVKFWRGLFMAVFVAALFWSLSLFDILGDEVGTRHAIWILLLMATAPAWLWLLKQSLICLRRLSRSSSPPLSSPSTLSDRSKEVDSEAANGRTARQENESSAGNLELRSQSRSSVRSLSSTVHDSTWSVAGSSSDRAKSIANPIIISRVVKVRSMVRNKFTEYITHVLCCRTPWRPPKKRMIVCDHCSEMSLFAFLPFRPILTKTWCMSCHGNGLHRVFIRWNPSQRIEILM